MTTLIISSEAWQDLQDIGDYIAHNNPEAAISFVARLEQCCSQIAQFPGIGRNRDKLQPNLKSLAEGNYLIFYIKLSDGIKVLRILHAARDIKQVFKQEH